MNVYCTTVEETKKQQQRAGAKPSKTMNKKKFLIRRDTPMDLTKKHLKKQSEFLNDEHFFEYHKI